MHPRSSLALRCAPEVRERRRSCSQEIIYSRHTDHEPPTSLPSRGPGPVSAPTLLRLSSSEDPCRLSPSRYDLFIDHHVLLGFDALTEIRTNGLVLNQKQDGDRVWRKSTNMDHVSALKYLCGSEAAQMLTACKRLPARCVRAPYPEQGKSKRGR